MATGFEIVGSWNPIVFQIVALGIFVAWMHFFQSAPISQLSSTALFDLSGRRLEKKPTKGIYIQNGKVLVK